MSDAEPARAPWPTGRRGALLVVAASLVAWIALPTAPNYDTATHLLWAHELLGGRAPDVNAAAAPTLHPLWLLLAVPVQLTGAGASLLQLVTILAFGVVIACALRLAADVAGRVAGALAALATASSFALILLAFKAYVDLPFLALVLTALVVERASYREVPGGGVEPAGATGPFTVPVLFFLAGLLRPEAWAFGLLFLAVRLVRGVDRSTLVRPVALIVAAPILWAIVDTVLSGDPLHSLTGTRALAEELGRPTGLQNAPKELVLLLGDLARPPAAAAGVLGLVLAVRLGGWRRVALPLVVFGAGCLGFLLVGALGLPLLQRYLLVPAVLLCVFAGIAGAVILSAALGRPLAGALVPESTAGGLPAAVRGVAAAALAVGAFGVAGYLVLKADSFRIVGQGVLREARWQRQATELIEDPRVLAAERCGPITLPTYRFIPELTLRAGLDAGRIVSRSTALGGTGPQPRGVALVIAGDRADKVRLGWAAGVPRTTNTIPPGFKEIARRGPFIATARC